MKVTGTSVNKIINMYEINKKGFEKNKEITKKDTVEISSLGKTLSSFAEGDITSMPKEKLEKIRDEISKGAYKVDARLVAEKMIEAMKKY
ncbi:flagellar biosynthesis anti-sigma factor FlgM [Clostridium thermopalmarium]|uniref:Negative regulator of flagellin synthesis n=1 Tax=Clostridium thermopalmarium DSM 5974 TaxID=1121340 RepID=A0A2T0AX42_9CLOT|nr:flagellar biosynthesis anti-sigma factor FlgM [Clostridium thermopalmarium]MBE6044691.1 flagellar biosynthesis anti-sigma factor FlgM [Clostridium thermopalmarium]PRR75387.1 Anti-sigma-28 factor, FlgM [Clostridium thermopalmarium DSM 5974]PVZ24289.1 FlgM family anti-sigma-28 factor [Clostridium thermopalmarium DSM 5974]